MTIGEKLMKERKDRGLTREALADRAGVTHVAIWKIETGRVSPRVNTLEKLAIALGFASAKYLLDGK
jgi:transcriptional regulator with XRE-family HTH domain